MKTVLKVIVILIVSFIVAAALFIGMRMYQGHKNIELVDKYLAEHNLTDKIKEEKTKYSGQKGLYYKEVKFKDNPSITYVVQPISTFKGIVVQGFDTETKKNIKKAKDNEFDDKYKPQ